MSKSLKNFTNQELQAELIDRLEKEKARKAIPPTIAYPNKGAEVVLLYLEDMVSEIAEFEKADREQYTRTSHAEMMFDIVLKAYFNQDGIDWIKDRLPY